MSVVHLHLLLNHVPTIGFVVALGFYIVSFVGKSDHLKQASLVLMVLLYLTTAVFTPIALLLLARTGQWPRRLGLSWRALRLDGPGRAQRREVLREPESLSLLG